MKALFTTLFVTGAFTLASQAQYVAQPYYGGGFGNFFIGGSYGFTDDDNNEGLQGDNLFSLELGSRYNLQNGLLGILSVEVLGSGDDFTGVDGDGFLTDFDTTSVGVMVNGKIGVQFHPAINVYVGAGIGVNTSNQERSDPDFGFLDSSTESVLGYQFMVGAEVKPFGDQIGFFAQYRYVDGEDFEGQGFTSIEGGFLDLGARFYF